MKKLLGSTKLVSDLKCWRSCAAALSWVMRLWWSGTYTAQSLCSPAHKHKQSAYPSLGFLCSHIQVPKWLSISQAMGLTVPLSLVICVSLTRRWLVKGWHFCFSMVYAALCWGFSGPISAPAALQKMDRPSALECKQQFFWAVCPTSVGKWDEVTLCALHILKDIKSPTECKS